MTKKTALITGITGQDGAYLSEFLLKKGYEVHGIKRRASSFNTDRIDKFYQDPHIDNRNFILHYGDLTDSTNLIRIIQEVQPDEIYNLGAMSHVKVSFEMPEYTADADGVGVLRILEAIRILGLTQKTKFYQASTSELYGLVQEVPQSETTPFYPRSPYAVAKMYAYWITVNYREAYGMFACNGILFNHESPLRGETFVTRKITRATAKIGMGLQHKLYLGNLDAKRDWGHAKDYCIDLDSEILTEEGFKSRGQIKKGDILINYNTKNSCWEKDKVTEIYDIPYEGFMYHFKGNHVSFRASANHRMFYKKKTKKHKAWSDLSWRCDTAENVSNMLLNKSLRTKYDFCFAGFDGLSPEIQDFAIDDNMIGLIGYLVTEGCWSFSKEIGRGSQLSVSQSKKKHFAELKKFIDNLKLTYTLREREDEVCEFIFSAEARDIIKEYFEGFDIHELPKICFKFSKRQLKILFNSMMNADGSWTSLTYVSKRKRLADDFKTVASLIGYRTSIRKRKSGIFSVTIFSHAKKSVNNFITDFEKQAVRENIWCVKSENNGSIISKKDDTIFVSGNCEGMWLMLQQDTPDDYVLATGVTTTVRDFVRMSFREIGVELKFSGEGEHEIGTVVASDNPDFPLEIGREVVAVDPRYFRPTEVELLLGDPTKAKEKLGWAPRYDLESMTAEMVRSDVELFRRDRLLKDAGFSVKNEFE